MRAVDELLEDDELLDAVYDAQGKLHWRVELGDGAKRQPRWFCGC